MSYSNAGELVFQNCSVISVNFVSSSSASGGFIAAARNGVATKFYSCIVRGSNIYGSKVAGFVSCTSGSAEFVNSSVISCNITSTSDCSGGFMGLGFISSISFSYCNLINTNIYGTLAAGFSSCGANSTIFDHCNVLSSNITASSSNAGGFISNPMPLQLSFSYCSVQCSIISGSISGGFAVYSSDAFFQNSSVTDSNITSAAYVGGLIAMGTTGSSINFTSCTLQNSFVNGSGAGGFVGCSACQISFCNSSVRSSSIIASGNAAGGFVGVCHSYTSFSNCIVNTTCVSAQQTAGGLIGCASMNFYVSNCFNFGFPDPAKAITQTFSNLGYSGGLFGESFAPQALVSESGVFSGVVMGHYAGGIGGYAQYFQAKQIFVRPQVFVSGSNFAGGLPFFFKLNIF